MANNKASNKANNKANNQASNKASNKANNQANNECSNRANDCKQFQRIKQYKKCLKETVISFRHFFHLKSFLAYMVSGTKLLA